MNDVTLTEGRLSFTFQDVDFAEQYDEWIHYRNNFSSACGSSKAVDFLVLKKGTIWLIEVKDYRRHKRTKSLPLADEIALKVRDTMAGIVSAGFLASSSDEMNASRSALSCQKLRVGFHLEQPSKPSRMFGTSVNLANLKMKLRQILYFADFHPVVFDRRSFPGGLGTVRSI